MTRSARLARLVEVLREQAPRPEDSLADLRTTFELAAAKLPAPEHVRARPASAGGVPAEWCEPPDAIPGCTVLHLHGGGYVLGSVAMARRSTCMLADAAHARTLSIDYRLAPEHPFPAAVEDAVTAYQWLLENGCEPHRLAIVGESAGGGLALACLVSLRDRGVPLPAAGVAISPWCDLGLTGASLESNAATDPQTQRWLLERMASDYLAGADPRTPLASPLFADLHGLPSLLIQAGGAEVLLDDAVRFARAAEAAGVDVVLECWEDMIHVWHAFAPLLPEGVDAIRRVGEFLNAHWVVSATATP